MMSTVSMPLTCKISARPSRRLRSGKNAPVVVPKTAAMGERYFTGCASPASQRFHCRSRSCSLTTWSSGSRAISARTASACDQSRAARSSTIRRAQSGRSSITDPLPSTVCWCGLYSGMATPGERRPSLLRPSIARPLDRAEVTSSGDISNVTVFCHFP